LFLNKPIFAFVLKESEIWDLLSKYKNTYLIENTNDFINAIDDLKNSEDWSVIQKDELHKYSRKFQMDILITEINKI
jgi:hypothetical protein